MGIGNLNVSVTASTRSAIANLKGFRAEVRGAGGDAKAAGRDFQGMTLRDFSQRFAAPSLKPAVRDLNTMQSSVVDLSRDVDRYKGLEPQLAKDLPLLRQMKGALGSIKTSLAGMVAAPKVFMWGVEQGQAIRASLADIHSWADAWTQLKAAFGYGDSIGDQELKRLEAQNKRGAERIAKLDAEREAILAVRAAADQAFAARMDEYAASNAKTGGYEDSYLFMKDQAQFGTERAMALERARKETEQNEREFRAWEEAEDKKREEREKAAEERERRRAAAQKKARENQQRDEEALQKLRDRLADFGKTKLQTERDELLRTLEDPRLRSEARDLYGRLEARENYRADRAAVRGRTPENNRALDARTSEGWTALRDSVRRGEDHAVQMLAAERQTADGVRRLVAHVTGGGGDGFDPFA